VLTGLILSLVGIVSAMGMAAAYKVSALRGCDRPTVLAVERVILLTLITPAVFWLGDLEPSAGALLLGALSGVLLVFGRLRYVHALEFGPASVSWFVLTLSQILPVAAAIFVFGERPNPLQVAGISLVLPALAALSGQESRVERGFNFGRWAKLITIAAGCEAVYGIFFLLVRELGLGSSRNLYLLTYNVTALVTALALRGSAVARPPNRWELRVGALSGVTTAVSAMASTYAIFYLPAYVYFPLVTSGVVVLFTAMSIVLWSERLTPRQWTGISLGLVAIVLVCLE
jgi:drug/metabolite transporter (DMT)-like permease